MLVWKINICEDMIFVEMLVEQIWNLDSLKRRNFNKGEANQEMLLQCVEDGSVLMVDICWHL